MAKKANEGAVSSLGRNMLSVAKFKKFLDQSKAKYSGGLHHGLEAIYERYMKGSVGIEVTVTDVSLAQNLAECKMRARGEIIEVFFAPLDSLTPIRPVIAKAMPPVNLFRELDRLATCAV